MAVSLGWVGVLFSMQLWGRAAQTAAPVCEPRHFRGGCLSLGGSHPLDGGVVPMPQLSFSFPSWGILRGLFLWSAWHILEDCSIKSLILTKDISTQTSKKAVYHAGREAPIILNQVLVGIVWIFISTFHKRKGILFKPGRIWRFPGCEILLTKVLSEGQGSCGLLCPCAFISVTWACVRPRLNWPEWLWFDDR